MEGNNLQNNQRVVRNTTFLYFRMLFSMCVSLYTSRVILHVLGVEDFGIYNVVGGVVAMFTFLNNAMLTTTQRFLNFYIGKEEPIEKLGTVFSTSVSIHILLAITILVFAETIGLWFVETKLIIPSERMVAARWVYHSSVMSTILLVATSPYCALVIARERMGVYAIISILDVLLRLLIVLGLPLFFMDKLVAYAVFLLFAQVFISMLYICYDKRRFKELDCKNYRDCSLFKPMVSFVGWCSLGSAAYISFTQGVNILLNIFFGPTVNAARGIATQVQNAILGLVSNFQMALNPQITKSYSAGDLGRMHNLIFTGCKISFFLLYIISLPVFFECQNIMKFWLVDVPDHTTLFVQLLLITILVEAISNPLSISAQATGQIRKFQIVLSSIQLSILPLSYIALQIVSMPEVVYIVHCGVMTVSQIVRVIFMKKMIKLDALLFLKTVYKPVLFVFPITIPFAYCVSLINYGEDIFFIALRCLLIVSFCALTIFFIGLSANERLYVINVIRKRI